MESSNELFNIKNTPRPLRDVSVNYSIDNEKCLECDLKPCLDSCPIDSIHLENNVVSLDENCIGCVLCSNACPYDAIHVERVMSEPIRENVPNINTKLCRACGACVNACKSGAIHLRSTGSEDMHSEIDEDKCVRCGYCFRACPTDAIKYGEILPKTIREGKTLCIDQDFCIGCMTCTRVCRSKGAINVGHTNKLPYIDPSYCARCNECLDSCPTYAIEYVEREEAFESFNKIKTAEIAYEILKRDMSKLSEDITHVDEILNDLLDEMTRKYQFEDYDFENTKYITDVEKGAEFGPIELFRCSNCRSIVVDITQLLSDYLAYYFDKDLNIIETKDVVEFFPPITSIEVRSENCVSCGLCVDVCPTSSLSLDGPNPVVVDTDNSCVYCGLCAEVCAFDAFYIEEKFFTNRNHEIFYIKRDLKGQRNGKINIRHDQCQLCGVCTKNCPVDVLDIVDGKVQVNQDDCISCRNCETICPVNAIKMTTIWTFL